MKEKIFTITDNSQALCAIWDNVKNPIGVIQIIHGIYDGIKTYDRFAKFMNKHGYIVFGTDRPPCAQGNDCPGLFDKSVRLQIRIMNYLSGRYNLPIFLFGYGYGGIITQSILQQSDIPTAGVCLSNTGKYPAFLLDLASAFAWICVKLFGPHAPANLLNFFVLGKRRLHKAQKCTYAFYQELFRGIKSIQPESSFNTPILMISNAHDSFATNPRFSRALYDAYRNNGIMHITLIVYPDKNDNLLLEMNFGTMTTDILDFLGHAKPYNRA